MIDAAHVVCSDKTIPTSRFVSMNYRTASNVLADQRNRVGLAGDNPRNDAATALASDGDYLALRMIGATVATISLTVFLALMAPKICTVDFDRARQLASGLNLSGHRLAEFVTQNECRHVSNVQISAQLKRRNSFD